VVLTVPDNVEPKFIERFATVVAFEHSLNLPNTRWIVTQTPKLKNERLVEQSFEQSFKISHVAHFGNQFNVLALEPRKTKPATDIPDFIHDRIKAS
jgi:hypothetical protein